MKTKVQKQQEALERKHKSLVDNLYAFVTKYMCFYGEAEEGHVFFEYDSLEIVLDELNGIIRLAKEISFDLKLGNEKREMHIERFKPEELLKWFDSYINRLDFVMAVEHLNK